MNKLTLVLISYNIQKGISFGGAISSISNDIFSQILFNELSGYHKLLQHGSLSFIAPEDGQLNKSVRKYLCDM